MRQVIFALGVFFLFLTPSIAKSETGKASFYSGYKYTANGERFYSNSLTAAHKTLPFGTVVRVENKKNGKFVDVRINNRGPFIRSRIVDLTPTAFERIASRSQGVVDVKVTVLEKVEKSKNKKVNVPVYVPQEVYTFMGANRSFSMKGMHPIE
jgi:rare lipoprotein A